MASRSPRRGAPTRADVARRAGVSASTVTYVLTGDRPISAETRERVQQAMTELGYTPNALASGLAGRRSRILALLLPSGIRAADSADLEYVTAAADEVRDLGYHLVLWTTDGDDDAEVLQLARTGLVDGVLLMEVGLQDERVDLLHEAGIPFALIGRTADPGEVPYADADAESMARTAVDHLVDLGHRHLAHLADPAPLREHGVGYVARLADGVRRRCEDRGIDLTLIEAEHSQEAGRAAFDRIVGPVAGSASARRKRRGAVTAVICSNWRATLGLMHRVRTVGVDVPGELSVLSLGSWDLFTELTVPPLTTIRPPAERIGRAAARSLVALLRGDLTTTQLLFPGELVVRGSTGPAPSPATSSSPTRRGA